MQIQTGTASVVNGSAIVTASAGNDWSAATINSLFNVAGVAQVLYTIADVRAPGVNPSGRWELTLSASYVGATNAAAPYAIHKDFSPLGAPIINPGDIATALLVNRGFEAVAAKLPTYEYGVTKNVNGMIDLSGTSHIALIPRSGSSYFFGDSQTEGVNSATQPYNSGGHLLPAYRWVNMLSTRRDRALTVNNNGVGGSKISWGGSNDVSHFNALGDLPWNWTGLACFMGGWNNTDSGTTTDAFFAVMQRAFEAMIARMLIDDWAGVTYLGWSRASGGSVTYGWATTGTNDQYTTGATNLIPFNISTGLAARYRTALTAGQFLTFTISGKRAVALFFETSTAGGSFNVALNGVSLGFWNNLYPGIGGNDSVGHMYPFVVWVDNLDAAASFVVSNVSGTQYFLGFGWVETEVSTASLVKKRQIIAACPPGNTANGRATTMLYELAKRMQSAVGAFAEYPVFFANTYDHWIQATDSESTDISHFTPSGNEHVFQAFDAATKVGPMASQNVIRNKRLEAVQPYSKTALPAAANYPQAMIYVWDEVGGPTIAFSDGTNWKRVADLAVVS